MKRGRVARSLVAVLVLGGAGYVVASALRGGAGALSPGEVLARGRDATPEQRLAAARALAERGDAIVYDGAPGGPEYRAALEQARERGVRQLVSAEYLAGAA